MNREQMTLQAGELGRAVGGLAPLGLPSKVLAETLRDAIREPSHQLTSQRHPLPIRFAFQWAIFGVLTIATFCAVVPLNRGNAGRSTLISNIAISTLLLGAAVLGCLQLVHVIRRNNTHQEVSAMLLDSAWRQAHAPNRTPPGRNHALVPKYPRPTRQQFGVSHEGAEHLVASWMRHLGAIDSEVTRYSGDGGIDVVSSRYIAQVKNLGAGQTVAVNDVRAMGGIAAGDRRAALFFTSGTYGQASQEFAQRAQMALFTYSASEGSLHASNKWAQALLMNGL